MSNSPVSHGHPPTEISHLGEETLTPDDQKRLALTRILGSETFRRSPRLREFLEYVANRTLDGHSEEVTENQLGAIVFQRGSSFNPAADNIVRATARALRMKLLEYYSHEGASDPLRIEIPKGRYTPEFHPTPHGETATTAGSGETKSPFSRWPLWAFAGVVLPLAVACTILVLENRELRQRSASVPAAKGANSLLSNLLARDCAVTIVASDALHTQLQWTTGRVTSLEEYSSRSIFAAPPPALSHSPDLWNIIRSNLLTQGDDVRAVVQLARSMSPECDVKFSHARSVTIHTFQQGGDFLILAGRRANPWAGLFEKDLQFQMIFPSGSGSAVFVNTKAKSGEQSEFRTVLNRSESGVAYGRVAVVPGLYGSGKVILVAGTSGETTFAAADFLTQPLGLQRLREKMGRSVNAEIRNLEVLIETTAIGGGTKDFRIVAVR